MESAVAMINDKYRLVERIAEGGQGEVWLALDSNDDEVAIKLLPRPTRALEQDALRARFADEVEAGQLLRSPNICRLIDSGELDSLPELHRKNGAFYIVMEYVEGGSLQDLIAEEQEFSLSELRRFVSCVSAALSVAHSCNPQIVHRDIKPANILLRGGALRSPKLADFGLARSSEGTRLTATGFGVGTSVFMAPEQILSSSGVTPAADQYSFALVLCQLLTGEVPGESGDLYGLLMQRQKGVEAPVVAIDGREAPTIRSVLQKALAPDPADRFGTIDEFADALDRAGIAEGWWATRAEGLRPPSLDEMELFVLDRRQEGGSVWVGGRAVDHSKMRSMFGQVSWRFEPAVEALGGADAYRIDGQLLMPWDVHGAFVAGSGQRLAAASATKLPAPKAAPTQAANKIAPKQVADKRTPTRAFMRPMTPSAELAAVIGHNPLPRTEATKRVW